MTYASRRDRWCSIFGIVSVVLLFFGTEASSLDTIHMAITGKNFQHVIYPIAQEKGYMREEGIDLKLLIIGATPSIQALFAGKDRQPLARDLLERFGIFVTCRRRRACVAAGS